ncbi:hypothetical protein J4729_20845 [Leisingera sp. HS039]|uniref:Uncharacterized protein n=1 Tax=Phaeobacter piscinae TaxID=1580596 RepID=A0AAN1GNW0_9RHOB|nr:MULTISPECIES: hypothetical protein [Roseobacteraceae]ATG42380.1 hypothetical protein PhaeoP13_00416 [Phaeobacter piscinae]AUR34714.1 hypothetical protein PhaeoP18_00417 [Phaeobacter piscinae]MBQ4826973.1 hypothetical protein [Leisingera sp. HS039]QBR35427.1 hypothetical protein ETW23_03995 [Leisingera sp. NJS201]
MKGRQVEPDQYTDKMREALNVILKDCDPAKSSSRKAGCQLYKELRKLMPIARPQDVASEAIWLGRNEYHSEDQRIAHLRDDLIRSAVSVPLTWDRQGRLSALGE